MSSQHHGLGCGTDIHPDDTVMRGQFAQADDIPIHTDDDHHRTALKHPRRNHPQQAHGVWLIDDYEAVELKVAACR
jgi:hypothetical protein